MKHVRRSTGRRSLPSTTLLGRLRIRSKLNLLLGLPLVAVLLVATPFVITQANSAQDAQQVADNAGNAREVGGLIWEIQRERLLTGAFLASPHADSSPMEKQQRKVDDTIAQVRTSLGTTMSDEIASALTRLGALADLRQAAQRRGIAPDSVARTYHALVDGIIDALRLVQQQTSDAEGTRQLTSLDALLHGNEYGELRGMALIAAAVNRQTGQVLLDDGVAQSELFTERFVQQSDVQHAGLQVSVVEGDRAQAVNKLAGDLPDSKNATAVEAYANSALSAVAAQSGLRRTVQDRITSQITDTATGRASSAATVAWLIGGGAAALFVLVALLSVVVSRSIASPLRKLTDAATSVADLAETELARVSDTEEGAQQVEAPRLAAIEVNSADELGQLAVAFNRVQSTASGLVERQAVTRRNVSLMFANVAQRTQNLVGRQLALVDELERNEQDSRLLASLYRLDHLSTRLRRNADNLLVVAGSREENVLGSPTELATSLRSALAEIEDYQRVRISDMPSVVLSPVLSADMVLVFAELLENATSFSPPGTFVEVSTGFGADGSCTVIIVDHGIGMKPPQLAEENKRLVERERLDVAPTSVLGLFVVGRLARRHGLNVMLVPSPGGGITARVLVPPRLFNRPMPEPLPEPERVAQPVVAQRPQPVQPQQPPLAGVTTGRLPVPEVPAMAIPPARPIAGFSWFPDFERHTGELPVIRSTPKPAAEPVAVSVPAPPPMPQLRSNGGEARSGLRRRVVGAQMPGSAVVPTDSEKTQTAPPVPTRQPQHDPAAARDAFDGFQTAFAQAAATPEVTPPAPAPKPAPEPVPVPAAEEPEPAERAGLSRRIPGANLAPGLRNAPARGSSSGSMAGPTAPPAKRLRDPEAERASFDAFSSGIARAVDRDPTKESTR